MISKTELGRVSNEIPGSGSGSGTRWALVFGPLSLMFYQIGKDTLLGTEIYRSPGISKIVAE